MRAPMILYAGPENQIKYIDCNQLTICTRVRSLQRTRKHGLIKNVWRRVDAMQLINFGAHRTSCINGTYSCMCVVLSEYNEFASDIYPNTIDGLVQAIIIASFAVHCSGTAHQ